MVCPCISCEQKGCGEKHSTCEGYLAWKAERDRIKEARYREMEGRPLSRDQEMKYRKNLKRRK